MAYHFYLGTMLCPIAPSKLQMKINNQNKTMTLINEGEVNILKQAGLTEISFDLLLPNVKYPFATYKDDFKGASYFLGELEKLKTSKQPFQFIVTRTFPDKKMLFDTNMKVSLESYDIKEDVKQGFDVTVSIKLKQYRDFATKTCDITYGEDGKPTVSVETTRPADNPPQVVQVTTYTIQEGDDFFTLLYKFYGLTAVSNLFGTEEEKSYANRVIEAFYAAIEDAGGFLPGNTIIVPAVE